MLPEPDATRWSAAGARWVGQALDAVVDLELPSRPPDPDDPEVGVAAGDHVVERLRELGPVLRDLRRRLAEVGEQDRVRRGTRIQPAGVRFRSALRAVMTVTGSPRRCTLAGRSRCSQCDTRAGSVEMMISS